MITDAEHFAAEAAHLSAMDAIEAERRETREQIAALEAENERLRVQAQGFGRPQGLPLAAADVVYLRDRAESTTDGLWVNPDVLVALLDVYEAACAYLDHDGSDSRGVTIALEAAVDRARSPRRPHRARPDRGPVPIPCTLCGCHRGGGGPWRRYGEG